MPRLILLLAIAFVLYILFTRVGSLPPHRRRQEYIKLGLGVTVVGAVILTAMGKMHWVGAALTGLLVAARQALPLLLRFFPLLGSLKGKTAGQAQHSTVSTAILRMQLDHETGAMSGDVIAGPFKDWRLDEMNREQLEQLRVYCHDTEAESLQLLEGYLDQRFSQSDAANDAESSQSAADGAMNPKEALEILGLAEDADRDAIVDAHRKLMQKLHPDRGGSDYLAAKINQAKDFLLKG